ncbi:acyl-CoA dehydrogenase [Sulfitobacter sp. PS-8MA]|uniref:acyl-CoA dehydrogenase n=1 Tax=Sulfitobacter sp. PS-8MA TaxID=3237707 RepID=UPI0034C6AB12
MNSAPQFAVFPASGDETPVLSDTTRAMLRANAPKEECGDAPIGASMDLLRGEGLMLDDGTENPQRTVAALMQIGAANLSVGRLWEGHVNALRLLRLYGSAGQVRRAEALIASGALLGVWGADGAPPVTRDENTGKLNGEKLFASGLGTVTHALITVNSGPEVQLALVDVRDENRADARQWDMLGMRATASGKFDFTGLSLDKSALIGAPGNYLAEPHFIGGVWRIAALQAGAAAGLIGAAAEQLRAADRLEAEAQKTRLMQVLMRVWAGMAMAERAATAAQCDSLDPERIVATSIAARLFTEEVGLEAISAVEQSLGLRHFTQSAETGRMARDLSVYLRQAARDAFLQRAAGQALAEDEGFWGVFK